MACPREQEKAIMEASIQVLESISKMLDLFTVCFDKTTMSKKMLKRKKMDPERPKQPKSSYLFFCDHIRTIMKKESPGLEFKAMSKISGERWNELSEKDREPFYNLFRGEQERYLEEMKLFEMNKRRKLEGQETNEKDKDEVQERTKKDDSMDVEEDQIESEEEDQIESEEEQDPESSRQASNEAKMRQSDDEQVSNQMINQAEQGLSQAEQMANQSEIFQPNNPSEKSKHQTIKQEVPGFIPVKVEEGCPELSQFTDFKDIKQEQYTTIQPSCMKHL